MVAGVAAVPGAPTNVQVASTAGPAAPVTR
jgi:hypothetical protein